MKLDALRALLAKHEAEDAHPDDARCGWRYGYDKDGRLADRPDARKVRLDNPRLKPRTLDDWQKAHGHRRTA